MASASPTVQSFSPHEEKQSNTAKCLADHLIAIIVARRHEINQLEFGQVFFDVKHYAPFAFEARPRWQGEAMYQQSAVSKKSD